MAFSCITPAGRVLYQKTLIHRDVLSTVRIEYPAADRKTWEPLVAQISGSLTAGRGLD